MRKAHELQENKFKEQPRYIVFCDSESRVIENVHYPYLMGATFLDLQTGKRTEKVYLTPRNLGRFWKDVTKFGGRNKKKVYVFAHNAFYDLCVTSGVKHVCKEGFIVDSFFEKGLTFILNFTKSAMVFDKKAGKKIERKLKTICVVSTTNYFSEALARLAKSFNMEKFDFDYAGGSIEECIPYNRQDINIIETAILALLDFIKTEDLGTFARTIPGQAFNAFRHRFMNTTIYIHDNEAAITLEREAYSGGRVECFKIGTFHDPENFYYYDVNSMYPFCMKEYEYPVSLRSFARRSSISYINEVIENGGLVIAKCRIKTDRPYFAVNIGGSLIFPIGEYWTALSTPEIKFAIENDLILETAEIAIYNKASIFVSYVDYFYNKRLEAKENGNKVLDKLYKLMLNSLYGKFGQRSDNWERVGNADINEVKAFEKFDTETGEFESFKIFGGSVFKKIGESEGFNSFCAVAAHVTAYARMTLLNFIMLSGWENCFYMDTDSLIVNKKGHENLLPFHNQKILGKIKEEKRDTKLIINCPKDYSFAGETKRKGIKKDSIQVDDMTFETTMWPKINSCIRSGSLNGYKNIDRKKVLTRAYNKGWVDKDGNVYPFTLKIHGKRENAILPPTVDTKDFYDMVRGKPQIKNQKDIILKKFRKYLMGNW